MLAKSYHIVYDIYLYVVSIQLSFDHFHKRFNKRNITAALHERFLSMTCIRN